MNKRRDPSASLEREVIMAVVILYVGICAVMLGVHFVEPGGPATTTSSMSPSTEAIAQKAPEGTQAATPPADGAPQPADAAPQPADAEPQPADAER